MTDETTTILSRSEQALQLSEEILAGIETETLSTSSAALRCLRLARLILDDNAIEWLQYETKGYPLTSDGKYFEKKAVQIALAHGRESVQADGKKSIFIELGDELEAKIQTAQSALGNITTKGVSIGGDYSLSATRELCNRVNINNYAWSYQIEESRRCLTVLRGQYYAYALSVNLELKFSKRAEEVFQSYRISVDKRLVALAPESLRRLDAAYERLSSSNPESWNQAVTSCRRVFEEISNSLYKGPLDKPYTTNSSKTLDISGDHYLNRLYATIDMIAASRSARHLVGSNVMYIVDFVENLYDVLCSGVHNLEDQLTYEEARACILHTYMLLGDISSLIDENAT